MKILFVNQSYLPDTSATALYLSDLAEAAVAHGNQVTVLTGQRGYLNPQELYQTAEIINGVTVKRIWTFPPAKNSRLLRIISAGLNNLLFFIRLLFLGRFELIVTLTSPPLIGFMAALRTKLLGGRLIYWVMDLNPEQAIRAGWLRADSTTARILTAILRFTLKSAHRIIALDNYMSNLLVCSGADPEKIAVLPLWVNSDLKPQPPEAISPFRSTHGWQDKFVVMYSGNHSICHPLDTVLEGARALKERSEIVFAFIGTGARVAEVAAFKARYGLDNVVQLPQQPLELLSISLSAADLHLVSLGPEFSGVIHPSKIYGILGVNRPFIFLGPGESFIADLVATSPEIGRVIAHGAVDALVAAITTFATQANGTSEIPNQKLAAAARNFSKQARIGQLLDRITASPGNV